MYTGFVHREVCGNTCKLWRYVCIQVLYTERPVYIHISTVCMYYHKPLCVQNLYTYISPQFACITTNLSVYKICGNTCKLWRYVCLRVAITNGMTYSLLTVNR